MQTLRQVRLGLDDAQAVATSVVLVSLGLSLLAAAGLMTGGTPGLAFLLSYATGMRLGPALFLVNLPFYLLALRGMGWRFTMKTIGTVAALSVGVEVVRQMLSVRSVDVSYAAVAGGILIGLGLLVLFRHEASLGGINVVALLAHRRFGWPVGGVQVVIDAAILSCAFVALEPVRAAWSLLAAFCVNAVLMFNHRPGRYRSS